jgi:membrane protein involved in colicin uptake
MRRELGYSLALHLAIILLGTVGLPYLRPDPPEMTERILVVDLSKVTVGEKTSLPKATAIDKPKGEPIPDEKKIEEKQTEPPKPEPPKAVPAPAPKPEPPKPEPKKEEPKAAMLDDAKKAEDKKKADDAKKAEDKKKADDAKKADEEKKKAQAKKPSFDDLMASVEKMRKSAPSANMEQGRASGGKTGTPGAKDVGAISKDRDGFGDVLTLSEMDMIRAQIERHWNVDPGKAGALDMVIEIAVSFDPNGTVRTAKIVDQARLGSDPAFRSLAESALRAVFMASPVQAPAKKYEVWREVRLFFRPQDRL